MSTDELRAAMTAVLLQQLDRKEAQDTAAAPGRSWARNGGTSLEAYAAVMRIEQELGVVVPVARLLGPHSLDDVLASVLAAPAAPVLQETGTDGRAVPATASQRRHWRHAQGEGSAAFLNMGHAIRCARDFDADRAESAFRALVARHESLRSVYLLDEEERLMLREVPDWPGRVVFESHGAAGSPEEATAAIRAAVGRPFSLGQEPPVRGGCVPLPDGGGVVYFAIHHIAADGWSTDLLAGEFLELYTSPQASLPDATPFSTYALTVDSRARRGDYADDIAYWRKKFERVSPDFTIARREARAGGQRAGSLRLGWDGPGEAEAVRAAARELGVTTYSLLLSALLASAHVLSGEDDVVVMSGVANRNSARVRDTVGLFTNQIFFLGDFRRTGGPAAAYVQDVHADVVESLGRSELPVEVVLDELDAYAKARTLAPYANILFQAADAPIDPPAIRDGSWTAHSLGTGSIKRHCNIHLVDTPDTLALDLDFSLALVGEGDARRLLTAVRAGVARLTESDGAAATVGDLVERVREAAGERAPELRVFTVDYPGARSEPALADFVRERFPACLVVELPVPRSLDGDEFRQALEASREAIGRVDGPGLVLSYCSASAWARYLTAEVAGAAGGKLRLLAVNGNTVTRADWVQEWAELVHRFAPDAEPALPADAPGEAAATPEELWGAADRTLAAMGECLEDAYRTRFGDPLGRVARETMEVQLAWLAYLGGCTVLGALAGGSQEGSFAFPGDLQDGAEELVARLRPELVLPGASAGEDGRAG
ncbi:condensation domain-containing protein [Streptomyces sp. NPDC048723]|uniref:condensation domain-containing protein n=1 Tax=Streptomyces sp. NPDC048723 TaxID=3365589 RepID=UPI00371BA987